MKYLVYLSSLIIIGCSNNQNSTIEGGENYILEAYRHSDTGIIDLKTIDTLNGQINYTFDWYYTSDSAELNPYEAKKYFEHPIKFKEKNKVITSGIYKAIKIENGFIAGSSGPQEESTQFIVE